MIHIYMVNQPRPTMQKLQPDEGKIKMLPVAGSGLG
jgi:hypothetical protein